ncbi:MAG: ATP-binding protein [Desulfobulbaceae bacterium]|nr:ATP-binding protein [Desulfobulbaceae bacterium]
MFTSLLEFYRHNVKTVYSITDILFLLLRLITILGCLFWLHFAPVPLHKVHTYHQALTLFAVFSFTLYLFIVFKPHHLRRFYLFSLLFDILFIYWWVRITNRYDDSFFLGYYLLVVLHTLYFGYIFGTCVATLSALLYLVNLAPHIVAGTHWTEPGLRISFLFLIGIPAGLIHGQLKRDNFEITVLNGQLSHSLTNLQRMQKTLIENEKLAALGRLTSSIAHEIRNPLSALGGLSYRLIKHLPQDTKEKQYAEVIVSEVSRLEAILHDIIVYTKTGTPLSRHSFNDTIHQAVHSAHGLHQNEEQIEIIEKYMPDIPEIYLDPQQINLAINNLVANSIDSMPEGGVLTVDTKQTKLRNINWVTVTINDTGQGISESKSQYIFEPFFSTKRMEHSTGLGLIIVHDIMDYHRGFIEIESEVDKGTSVTMHFPYQSPLEDTKIACWQYIKCDIEKDPSRRCQAYPSFGRSCWAIAGTMCEKRVTGTYAEKIQDCMKCTFYQECNNNDPHGPANSA